MIMIDLTVTASDDVESSANVKSNFQRLFPSMHEQVANACTDCLSCHHQLPSFPFLACNSAVFITGIVKPKRSQNCYGLIGNKNLLRMARQESLRRGQWHSPLQVCDQCRPMRSGFLRVVWRGAGMAANLCSWAFGYGRNVPKKSYFYATICMVVWYYIWLFWHVSEWRNCTRAQRKIDLCAPGVPKGPKVGVSVR